MRILENATTEYFSGSAPAESAVSVQLTDAQQALVDAIRSHTETTCLQNSTDSYFLQELSPIRQNLMDWIAFSEQETVLELGGRTGILTKCLCGRCKTVTSIVTSEPDAYVNAVRNGGSENLRIWLSGNRHTQNHPRENAKYFDTVTLVGADAALYQGIFSHADASTATVPKSEPTAISDTAHQPQQQYEQLLALAHDCLKPGGRLILAINNRLGIQYWSGKTDVCSPALFGSIQGDTEGATEYCFSKKQLSSMLEKTGFEAVQFYYPVPDYRYPTQIFSDAYLPQVGDIRPTSTHYDDVRYQLFDEKKAFDSLCADGLFDQFANSFLVLCEKGGEQK